MFRITIFSATECDFYAGKDASEKKYSGSP